jgi:hypothetical protein
MTALLRWIHVFRPARLQFDELIRLFVFGVVPDPDSGHRLLEKRLGINEACVYAYLGRAEPAFGGAGLALPLESMSGSMTPFDTGGIDRHIAPVGQWDDEQKRQLIAQYSWQITSDAHARLAEYPGEKASLEAYLAGNQPTQVGPHEIWNRQAAPIWNGSNKPRAWTWEGRREKLLPTGPSIYLWTCPAHVYPSIRERWESASTEEQRREATWMQDRYFHGGVSRMIARLREEARAS